MTVLSCLGALVPGNPASEVYSVVAPSHHVDVSVPAGILGRVHTAQTVANAAR